MPSHIEVAGISGVLGTAVVHSALEIAGISGLLQNTNASYLEIAGISGTLATTNSSHIEIAGISGTLAVPAALQARVQPGQTIPAVAPKTLDASASVGPWTSITWSQISGPPQDDFAIAQVGSVVTYTPDPQVNTYTLVFQADVTDGLTHSLAQVTDTVVGWQFWTFQPDGTLIPEIEYILGATDPLLDHLFPGSDIYPGSTLFPG